METKKPLSNKQSGEIRKEHHCHIAVYLKPFSQSTTSLQIMKNVGIIYISILMRRLPSFNRQTTFYLETNSVSPKTEQPLMVERRDLCFNINLYKLWYKETLKHTSFRQMSFSVFTVHVSYKVHDNTYESCLVGRKPKW